MNKYLLKIAVVILLGISSLLSCVDKSIHPDVSKVNVDFDVIPFYKLLNAVDTINVSSGADSLFKSYPQFMEAYCKKIIRVGGKTSPQFEEKLRSFITYDPNKDILEKAKEVFNGFGSFEKEMELALKHYKYYYPKATIPDIYLMISGFSHSIAVDSSWVGVSIEKYLGADCEFYEWVGIQNYLRIGMTKEKMAADIIRAMALSSFPKDFPNDDVINNMIYQGKMRYFVHRMMPELNDTLLFDYTDLQLKWCKENESDMWASLVEWKHIFTDDKMLIRKYTDLAPFTANFGNNSAPRAGEYIGFKIIESYLKNNKEATFQQLMKERDGRKILAGSKYRP